MEIKEILALTFTKKLEEIARDHLLIAYKPLKDALKEIGCEQNKGGKGWIYKGDQMDILEKSIYDFVQPSKRKVKASNDASKELAVTSEVKASKKPVQASKKPVQASKKMIDAIDMLLLQNDSESKRIYRGFYWDADIIRVIDNVKHGNKSDLMNEIVRTVLKQKGLID